jgi:hypothetical protein
LIDTQPHFTFTPQISSLFVIIYDNPTHHVRKAADLNEQQPIHKERCQRFSLAGFNRRSKYALAAETCPRFCESGGRWVKLNPSRHLKGAT